MAMKHILRYLQGMPNYDLLLCRSSCFDRAIYIYWAGCSDTRGSTLGYAVFLGDNLVPWSTKW
jgi:hypothetical protein